MYSATFNYEVARSAVAAALRTVPDFPKPGIMFRDITPVLADPELLRLAVLCHLEAISDVAQVHGRPISKVVGIESRGFLFGMAVAHALGAGFVPVRKPGKLPAATVSQFYGLEYGTDELHLHADAVGPGDRVLVVDDLLATGGTAGAAATLVRRLGGEVVSHLFLIELADLGGRAKLLGRVDSVLTF